MSNVPRQRFAEHYAERVGGKPPCKGCPDRYPGCAGACDRYQTWKNARHELMQEYHKKVSEESEVEAVHRQGRDKILRRQGKKVGTQGR